MNYSEDTMWQATVACCEEYDGLFFYAVKTVGVYCRPSCKSRTPLRKNVLFFASGESAEIEGFRPCKRCRPDLIAYAPMAQLAGRAKGVIDEYFCERARLAEEMKKLGVSPGYLSAVFKRLYGLPPMDYLNQRRLLHAKHLLTNTKLPIMDIAFDVGFSSLSAFYSFFKKHTGHTPGACRAAGDGTGTLTKEVQL